MARALALSYCGDICRLDRECHASRYQRESATAADWHAHATVESVF